METLTLPTFSDDTDWNNESVQKELFDAVTKYGCCYYEMSALDKELYSNICPPMDSFFKQSMNDKDFVSSLPNFGEYLQKYISYGYTDQSSNSRRKPCQARAFCIPIDQKLSEDINVDKYIDKKLVETYANNMLSRCNIFLKQILRLYFNKHGWKNDDEIMDKEMNKLFGNIPSKHLRFNYYDPLALNNSNKIRLGCNEHRDIGFFTLLAQSSPGFEMKYDSKWHSVKYDEDKYLINIGEVLEMTTNSFCHSVLHRVPMIRNKSRMSIAFFYDPDVYTNMYQYDEESKNGESNIMKLYGSHLYGNKFEASRIIKYWTRVHSCSFPKGDIMKIIVTYCK